MKRNIVKQREIKERVFLHYGKGEMACVRCGFNNIRALSIDHVDSKGQIGKRLHGNLLYQWLEKMNYPDGFQTLCMNCQWIKRVEEKECRVTKGMTAEERYEAFRRKFASPREKDSKRVTKKMILKWAKSIGGDFKIKELVWEFGVRIKETHSVYVYLHRLVTEGKLERVESGHYKVLKARIKPVKVFG